MLSKFWEKIIINLELYTSQSITLEKKEQKKDVFRYEGTQKFSSLVPFLRKLLEDGHDKSNGLDQETESYRT